MSAGVQFLDYAPVVPGQVMSIKELREIGRETLEGFRADAAPKQTGRRADATTPYLEGWAQRYWRSQRAVERDRLRQGRAKHRAHRDPIPGKPDPK